VGYRVLGPGLVIWEPSLGEAVERFDELEELGDARTPAVSRAPAPPFESIVYGPVRSRRLGRSLGVNLSPPGIRVCNYACQYCAVPLRAGRGRRARWPSPEETAAALADALPRTGELDSITISGHGEPTLHPRFAEVVEAVMAVARAARPGTPVRILTNASGAAFGPVREALDRLDERIVKLDADVERVCSPAPGAPLGATLTSVARLRDVTLQSCFVAGSGGNTAVAAVDEWIELVAEVRPLAVQVYTIDLPPARAALRPASRTRLEEIAELLRARTGLPARVYA
jgi:wyosine [tRNA(Phe)-imidazoG37] synthetase (radical SAM superfamily)